MQNFRKNVNGITLMALVVTIIILLILAGISIGMLSGDNSIINQAGNAKTQTDIAEEKEILEKATVIAMGKSKYGNIEETDLKKELENVAEVTPSGSKFKVTFPSERQYLIDQDGNVKEKNPNAMEISELYDGASTYFGWDVINYTETLDSSLNYMEWQLFYAGALDGESEERIYLISKNYVKNTDLPTVIKNGVEVSGAKPIAIDGSNYKATFTTNGLDGVSPQYDGSASIVDSMKKLNNKFFDYLAGQVSEYGNMKSVAYMLDTTTWKIFTGQNADYTIGGPTVEMLFKAYNKYKNKAFGLTYETQVTSKNGYQISRYGETNYADYYTGMIDPDTTSINSPYSISSISNDADYYWLASPSKRYSGVMVVGYSGEVNGINVINGDNCGFRPIVCLNSAYTLEKTKDSNGNDAFKIVEQ